METLPEYVCLICGSEPRAPRRHFCSVECASVCPGCKLRPRAYGTKGHCHQCIADRMHLKRDRRCHRCGGPKRTNPMERTKRWFCEPCSRRCTKCDRPRVGDRGAGNRGYCAFHLWERQIARYGLTGAQWHALFESQGRKCAVCQNNEPGRKPALIAGNAWCTDHDHETGMVRGILCQYCNKTLGHFGDTIATMRKRIAQFERYLVQPALYAGQRP